MTRVISGSGLFLLLVLLFVALYALVMPKMDAPAAINLHPVVKHGATVVEQVDACFAKNGAMVTYENQQTGRRAKICQSEDGRFALEITDTKGNMITKFFKDKMKTLDEVVRYLANRGYQPVK